MVGMAPYVRSQWLEILGIKVNWLPLSWSTFINRMKTERPDIWVAGWQVDYPDPHDLLWRSEWRRHTSWQNETYKRLIEEARSLTDQRQRVDHYQQAEKILIEQAAIVPVYYARQHILLKPWVRRFPSSALIDWYWKDVIIEPH